MGAELFPCFGAQLLSSRYQDTFAPEFKDWCVQLTAQPPCNDEFKNSYRCTSSIPWSDVERLCTDTSDSLQFCRWLHEVFGRSDRLRASWKWNSYFICNRMGSYISILPWPNY